MLSIPTNAEIVAMLYAAEPEKCRHIPVREMQKFVDTFTTDRDDEFEELLEELVKELQPTEESSHDHTNVDALDSSGWTPLALAVRNGHLRCARLLLSVGANPMTRAWAWIECSCAALARNSGRRGARADRAQG